MTGEATDGGLGDSQDAMPRAGQLGESPGPAVPHQAGAYLCPGPGPGPAAPPQARQDLGSQNGQQLPHQHGCQHLREGAWSWGLRG